METSLYFLRFVQSLWILLLTICIVPKNAMAQSLPTNLQILDSLAARCSHDIVQAMHGQGHDTVRLELSAHAAAQLFRQHLFSDSSTFTFYRNDSNVPGIIPLLSVIVSDCSIRYFLYEPNNDSLIRQAQVILACSYANDKGRVQALPEFSTQYRDTINRMALPFVESRQYDFANAPVPEAQTGFFTEVAEPLIVVSAAIITIVLLFTVRSQ